MAELDVTDTDIPKLGRTMGHRSNDGFKQFLPNDTFSLFWIHLKNSENLRLLHSMRDG